MSRTGGFLQMSITLRAGLMGIGVALFWGLSAATAHAQPAEAARGLRRLPPRFYEHVHVLCVGVDQYRSAGITELQWAEGDAQAVAAVLANQYGYRVQQLLGRKATKSAILRQLESYERELGEDDALLVFFAGHGQTVEVESLGRAGFLLAYDSELSLSDTRDVDQWREQALDMHELGRLAERLKAKHVLFLVDACYSGFLGRRSGFAPRADLQALVQNRSRMVITAGTEQQVAIEDASLKHGIFTHFLLKQLERPEAQSASELFVALRMAVAGRTENRMLPQLREIVVENGEFVFFPAGLPDTELKTEIARFNQRLNSATAKATKPEDVFVAYEAQNYRFTVLAPEQQREWEQRLKRFEDNASLGQPLAMAGLSHCYAKGLGVEPDAQRAYQWARTAYDSGHSIGLQALGEAYLRGVGVPKNILAGERLVHRAAEQGDAISQYVQASRLLQENAAAGDLATAQQLLTQAAQAGLPSAKWRLGELQLANSKADRGRAVQLIREAAEKGLAAAQYAMYQHTAAGIDGALPASREQARAWLGQAAAGGYPVAQYRMACECYQRHGATGHLGLPQNDTEAFKWASVAADQQCAEAYKLLAYMYAFGHGVQQNIDTAKKYKDLVMASQAADVTWLIEWTQAVLPIMMGER